MARPRQMADEEILGFAREVFLEHGPSASTTLVAERCGMSQASLFKRFGDKQTLLVRSLLPDANPPFLDLLARGPTEDALKPQLLEIAREMLAWFRHVVPCVTTLAASGVNPHTLLHTSYEVPPPIRTLMALSAWFDRAGTRLRDVPATHLATQFLGALHVRAFMQHIAGHEFDDPAAYLESMVDVFLNGVER